MRDLSIDAFWKKEFSSLKRFSIVPLTGWCSPADDIYFFVEPKLSLRDEFSDLCSRIWLVSAPGAVGKSTLAKRIANQVNAIYLNLSQAEAVGGNYIYGGLAKTKSQKYWDKNETTLFIDALDEARMRVTNQSFMDFLQDIIAISDERRIPIVLFGRSGVMDDVTLYLMEHGIHPAIFDIEYFDAERSEEFIEKYFYHLLENKKDGDAIKRRLSSDNTVFRNCISKIVKSLDTIPSSINNSFSGYSPVLQAIATFVLSETANFYKIDTEIENLLKRRILEKICRAVLEREQQKLKDQVMAMFPELSAYDLYNISEQIKYLAATIQRKEPIFETHSLQGDKLECYSNAVKDFLSQHPFLSGDGKTPANAVFDAAILSYAMKQGESFLSTLSEATINPLLAEFYFYDSYIYNKEDDTHNNIDKKEDYVKSEHVVPIFNSISAQIGQGKKLELSIEAEDSDDTAKVIISCFSQDAIKEEVIEEFSIPHHGCIVFHERVSNVYIDAPFLEVEILANKDAELTAPIDIHALKISFLCETLRIYPGYDKEQVVTLEAEQDPAISPKQIISYAKEFEISWPNDRQYPWTEIGKIGNIKYDGEGNVDDLQRALLSFSRLIRAFRSHSKGEKARFVDKIDHARMSKNFGKEICEKLMEDSILIRSGIMYILDTDKLGKETGTSYLNAKQRHFGEKTKEYLQKIICTTSKH